ncbi:MAG: response regulator [Planctomycetota bacterium]
MTTQQGIKIDDESVRRVLLDDSDPLLQRILVVDSDPYVPMNCRLLLHGKDSVVYAAENLKEAVEKLSKEEFDLIISDIMFPDVYGGFTFVQKAMKMQPWADIVITTDSPSIWDARDSVKLGAFKYIEKPLLFEYMTHIASKVFDRQGWILRKSHIDLFRHHIVTDSETDHPIYYKNGSWAKHHGEDIWEIGYDLNLLPSTSQMPCCIHMSEGLSALKAGTTYAKISNRAGETFELPAPITGTLKEVNEKAVNSKFSLSPLRPCADWPLKLAVIQTKEGA